MQNYTNERRAPPALRSYAGAGERDAPRVPRSILPSWTVTFYLFRSRLAAGAAVSPLALAPAASAASSTSRSSDPTLVVRGAFVFRTDAPLPARFRSFRLCRSGDLDHGELAVAVVLVVADSDGDAFTSMSHGLSDASMSMSYP